MLKFNHTMRFGPFSNVQKPKEMTHVQYRLIEVSLKTIWSTKYTLIGDHGYEQTQHLHFIGSLLYIILMYITLCPKII